MKYNFGGNREGEKMKIIDITLDFIFPPVCGICDKIGKSYICEKCYKEIEKYLYHNENNKQDDNFYLLKYESLIRQKMIEYKFNDKPYLHHMFCEIFVKNKNACEFLKNYDIIIPVPMNKKKKRARGYNQTELIAKELSKHLNIQTDFKILLKQKNTPMQSSLGRNARIKNVQNVYKVMNKDKIIGKNVLILDDIYTTGATIQVCKKELQLAGAQKVGTIIIAKD